MPWRWAMQAAVHQGTPGRERSSLHDFGVTKGPERPCLGHVRGRAQAGPPLAGVVLFQGGGPGQGLGLGLIEVFRAEAGNLGQEAGNLLQFFLFQAFH